MKASAILSSCLTRVCLCITQSYQRMTLALYAIRLIQNLTAFTICSRLPQDMLSMQVRHGAHPHAESSPHFAPTTSTPRIASLPCHSPSPANVSFMFATPQSYFVESTEHGYWCSGSRRWKDAHKVIIFRYGLWPHGTSSPCGHVKGIGGRGGLA